MPIKHYEVGDWVKIYSNSYHIFAGAWVKIVKVENVSEFVHRYIIEFDGENYRVDASDIERHSPSAANKWYGQIYKPSYRYGTVADHWSARSLINYSDFSETTDGVRANWSSVSDSMDKFIKKMIETYYIKMEEKNKMYIPEIKNVYFNDPCTVVIWEDKTKTIVRCSENDFYDPEKGLAMAIIKKIFGNDNSFHKIFKKWVPEEEPTKDYMNDLFKNITNGILSGLAQAGYPLAKADTVKSDENGTVVECHYEED